MYSKLPWCIQSNDPHWMREVRDCDNRGIAWCGSFPEKEAHANAALIVRAVNSHADLITAVKSLIEWIDSVPEETILPAMPGIDRDWLETILDKAQS